MDRKRMICAVILIVACSGGNGFGFDDTAAHFGISALFGAGTVLHDNTGLKDFGRVTIGTARGRLPGRVKEIADRRGEGNEFSGSDFAADVGGAFTGAFLSNLFNHVIQVRIKTGDEKQVALLFTRRF